MIYQAQQYGHSTDPSVLIPQYDTQMVGYSTLCHTMMALSTTVSGCVTLINVSSFVGVFIRYVAFHHGSELTSIAVDDKGIVQFAHTLLHFFEFKSAIFNA